MSPTPPEPEAMREAMNRVWALLAQHLTSPAADIVELKDVALCVQRLCSAYNSMRTADTKRPDDATGQPPPGLTPEDFAEVETRLSLM